MARFFIHVENGDGFVRDTDGLEFENELAAQHEAIRSGVAIMADEIMSGCREVRVTLHIDDEDGKRLHSIPVIGCVGVVPASK